MEDKDIINFIFEMGMLMRVKHEGWRLLNAKPDSVGEHSLRAAQIGFILAHMEHYKNPEEVATILVFHDIAECRIGDIHKVANRYINVDEEKVVSEQTASLEGIGESIINLWKQVEEKNTVAGIIAKDADYLETATFAKELVEKGYKDAENWMKNVEERLKTESAKKLMAGLWSADSNEWWHGLKKLAPK